MVPLFLLQIAVIVACSQALGRLFQKMGQPRVVGEMTAGIALGPSLLGWIAPQFHQALFPEASLGLLNVIGQLGLIFYMFLVGMTLNIRHLSEQRAMALTTSLASITVPFVSGVVLAWFLYRPLSIPGVPLPAFALFLAVCMSITAFPVLARILDETGLIRTRLGSIAIASAAADDVMAWLILAAILAFLAPHSQNKPLGFTLAMLGTYILGMLVLRRFWRTEQLAAALVVALVSSCLTEWIGVHALFGAFFAGAVIPKTPKFVEAVRGMIEPLTMAIFLPVFFAATGLRTRFGMVVSGDALVYTLLILVVAVAGKWLGAMFAARLTGMSFREASALGILMNTRGLVELVILSIGFDLGLISPVVFSMMVMMALITTLMTAPLVRRVYPVAKETTAAEGRNGPPGNAAIPGVPPD